MAKRIGEILVEKGVITAEQLRVALRLQLSCGGHLGTCLIELQYLDEEGLGQVLAEIHRVNYATPERFLNVAPSVLECIPTQFVERRRVVPIQDEGGALHVAMANPSDLDALDELEFMTGRKIRPWVAPEVRIVQAMERYYGIPRGRRFIWLSSNAQDRRPDRPAPFNRVGEVPTIPLAIDPNRRAPMPSLAARTTETVPSEAPAPALLPALGADAEWTNIGRELFQAPSGSEPGAHTGMQEATVEEVELLREFERISEVLCSAAGPSDVARAVLECAARGMSRCILFVVRNLEARIWDWRGAGLDPKVVARARFPVNAEGVFELLAGSEWYRGVIPHEPSQIQFYRGLDLAVPTEALMVPVYFEERLTAILYGDGGDLGKVVGTTDLYRRLASKMGLALTALAIKRKLRRA
jgi:hypothetical protein